MEVQEIVEINGEEIKITPEYRKAIDLIEGNESGFVFITGKAGTGKSTFLKVLLEVSGKKFACLAPTGIAALNVKGQTIHSYFRFDTKMNFNRKEHKNPNVIKNLKEIDFLIIDEISMVRADLLDRVDKIMRVCLSVDEPFGGKMIVAIGDLFQLSPVVSKEEKQYYSNQYDTPFFFGADVMKQVDLHFIEFEDIFRQTDQSFIRLLNNIRKATVADATIQEINKRICINHVPQNFQGVVLCTTNASAGKINQGQLDKLEGEPYNFYSHKKGEVSSLPNDEELTLKEGAKVVFIKNDSGDGRYKNGETGVIREIIKKGGVVVEKSNGQEVVVEKTEWTFYSYEGGEPEIVGSFYQLPIKLGWAITIHKSQGMSIDDDVIIDTGFGCFAEGQFYVAMSRVVDPKRVWLKNRLTQNDIKVPQDVVKWISRV